MSKAARTDGAPAAPQGHDGRGGRGGHSDPRVQRIDPCGFSQPDLAGAVACLRAGQAVIFPTDTVYGIGVAVGAAATPQLLFQLKKRDRAKSIPWLVAEAADLERFGASLPPYCLELAQRHWPGALTLVVRASSQVPAHFCAGDGTIALRMPDCNLARALIRAVGVPLATTSANISGKAAVARCADLDPQLAALVPLVLDAGDIMSGQPSTIVSCTGPQPVVVRQGGVRI